MMTLDPAKVREALEGATEGPWREGSAYRSVVSDAPSGYDDELNVNAYGGHMVCESVMEHNRPLIAMSKDLARDWLRMREALNEIAKRPEKMIWGEDSEYVVAATDMKNMALAALKGGDA